MPDTPLSRWDRITRRFRRRSEMPKTSAVSRHVLDLQQQQGHLRQRHLDLPSQPVDAQQYYLRRRERWLVPPSYRTGMVFFTSIMVVAVLGVSGIAGYSSAESRQRFLGAQILQEFTELAAELEQHTTGKEAVPAAQVDTDDEQLVALEQEILLQADDPIGDLLQSSHQNAEAELLRMGLDINKGYQSFQRFVETWGAESEAGPLDSLRWMRRSAQSALEWWDSVLDRAQYLSLASFATDKQEHFQQTLSLIADLSRFLFVFDNGFEGMMQVLGDDEPQRVLILVQDDHQRRATGGALSAGVEVLLENGSILAWRPFHVDEYDDRLRVQLQPPIGLGNVTERWDLSTANAFLDGPKSAEQVHWFWQREARSSLDMVVFVTTSGLERFFTESGVSDSLENLSASQIANTALRWSALQLRNDREGLKSTASELLSAAVEVLQDPDLALLAWPVVEELVAEKHLLLVSSHPQVQEQWEAADISGALPDLGAEEDVLMVARVNTDTNASDRWIDESYRLDTAISADGSIQHWLKIHLQHSWQPSYLSALQDQVADVGGGEVLRGLSTASNRSLIKVLVPKGSQLINADGLLMSDITTSETDAYTLWSFTRQVNAGQGIELALSYTLPWSFDVDSVDQYRLRLIKQAGSASAPFEHHLKLPAQLTIFQQTPEQPVRLLDRNQALTVVAGRNP